jgi:hypothetical protein
MKCVNIFECFPSAYACANKCLSMRVCRVCFGTTARMRTQCVRVRDSGIVSMMEGHQSTARVKESNLLSAKECSNRIDNDKPHSLPHHDWNALSEQSEQSRDSAAVLDVDLVADPRVAHLRPPFMCRLCELCLPPSRCVRLLGKLRIVRRTERGCGQRGHMEGLEVEVCRTNPELVCPHTRQANRGMHNCTEGKSEIEERARGETCGHKHSVPMSTA